MILNENDSIQNQEIPKYPKKKVCNFIFARVEMFCHITSGSWVPEQELLIRNPTSGTIAVVPNLWFPNPSYAWLQARLA